MEDNLKIFLKSGVSQHPLLESSSKFKLKLRGPNQTLKTFDFAQILELSLAYQSFIKVSDACKYQPEVQANCLSLRLSAAHPSLFIDQVGYIC